MVKLESVDRMAEFVPRPDIFWKITFCTLDFALSINQTAAVFLSNVQSKILVFDKVKVELLIKNRELDIVEAHVKLVPTRLAEQQPSRLEHMNDPWL